MKNEKLSLEEAKEIMSKANTVAEWNELREELKDKVNGITMVYIDNSGFINQVLPKTKTK